MKYSRLTLTQVQALAAKISKNQKQYGRILGLVGTLGSGKTTFTQAFAKTLGIKQAKSPTFVIVHCYQTKNGSLNHIDLYRLDKASELKALELDELLADQDTRCIIEWVDKFPSLMKKCDTIIKFEILPNNLRNVIVTKP